MNDNATSNIAIMVDMADRSTLPLDGGQCKVVIA